MRLTNQSSPDKNCSPYKGTTFVPAFSQRLDSTSFDLWPHMCLSLQVHLEVGVCMSHLLMRKERRCREMKEGPVAESFNKLMTLTETLNQATYMLLKQLMVHHQHHSHSHQCYHYFNLTWCLPASLLCVSSWDLQSLARRLPLDGCQKTGYKKRNKDPEDGEAILSSTNEWGDSWLTQTKEDYVQGRGEASEGEHALSSKEPCWNIEMGAGRPGTRCYLENCLQLWHWREERILKTEGENCIWSQKLSCEAGALCALTNV